MTENGLTQYMNGPLLQPGKYHQPKFSCIYEKG